MILAVEDEQASPEVRARVTASFERQGLMRHLGARLAHIALPHREELTQQHGYFHAGTTSAIADSAGGYAAFTLFAAESTVLTVEYKINLLAHAGRPRNAERAVPPRLARMNQRARSRSTGPPSRCDSPFQARFTRCAATSSRPGLRTSSHHCPVSATRPTSAWEYSAASLRS
ncbi:hypothetical protein EV193_103107 [Herbihabitans rhizosphaerae]|uniref:DUF4442 domain-containing protein n=1 Tax=Herbihabitans rhizosphaerae TaxID=1872711 RepID=A0A4Q7KVP9_9PSEU|nr:hypothetical protein EV193_103107 [Herbihabitans rhizosphaerae]